MEDIFHYIGFIFFALGAYFVFTGSVGMVRMPDFFSRLHPAGIGDSMGMPMILIGLMFNTEFGIIWVKILLLILFSIVTSATSAHALAKTALVLGVKPVGKIVNNKKAKRKGK